MRYVEVSDEIAQNLWTRSGLIKRRVICADDERWLFEKGKYYRLPFRYHLSDIDGSIISIRQALSEWLPE